MRTLNGLKSKHIDIKVYFNKDIVGKLMYVPSDKHIADVFTKSLNREKHVSLLVNLNMI